MLQPLVTISSLRLVQATTDGTMLFDHKKARVGAIWSDSCGRILIAASLVEHETSNPEFIKVLKILKGI